MSKKIPLEPIQKKLNGIEKSRLQEIIFTLLLTVRCKDCQELLIESYQDNFFIIKDDGFIYCDNCGKLV